MRKPLWASSAVFPNGQRARVRPHRSCGGLRFPSIPARLPALSRLDAPRSVRSPCVVGADPPNPRGRPNRHGWQPTRAPVAPHRGSGDSTSGTDSGQCGKPGTSGGWHLQRRLGRRLGRVAERAAVSSKPGSAGGGKGPYFWGQRAQRSRGSGDWREPEDPREDPDAFAEALHCSEGGVTRCHAEARAASPMRRCGGGWESIGSWAPSDELSMIRCGTSRRAGKSARPVR